VLLSGGADDDGEAFVKASKNMPIFGAASEEDTNAATSIRKILGLSANPDSQLSMFKNAGHAASMFDKEPDLEADIVLWFRKYLPVAGYGALPGAAIGKPRQPLRCGPHIVGSVALDTPGEVFETIGRVCGRFLKRIPDGEPGGRRLWISWQIPVLRANPSLAQVGEGQIPLKLADGAGAEQIHFGELGYAREARPSYEDFREAKRRRHIAPDVRFQVSLPTPWAVVMPFCRQPDAQQISRRMRRPLREVTRICSAIPHRDLSIQWDVCIEMLAWDGRWQNAPSFPGMEQVFAGNCTAGSRSAA
jgi:hypothetical protein